jgi:hypothetical protein
MSKIFIVKADMTSPHTDTYSNWQHRIEITPEELEHAKMIFGMQLIETEERVGESCSICESILKKLEKVSEKS